MKKAGPKYLDQLFFTLRNYKIQAEKNNTYGNIKN
ncbi:hypothetical protein SAMN05192533_104116 [Mesobacillus persicus]|uniref:Uncharacterized protein n=1 Tax=Mesobacillus persicus TaxID=930146 RepID=A0A1H7ZY54_9BACI|nr:hypothetical protein SAMN05192533_104116 [Mesobacillus persicus]